VVNNFSQGPPIELLVQLAKKPATRQAGCSGLLSQDQIVLARFALRNGIVPFQQTSQESLTRFLKAKIRLSMTRKQTYSAPHSR
jgi:hypothetical protein